MSLKWLTSVWENSPYKGAGLLIHLGMADHADDDGRFFLSQARLSRKARCTVEFVRRSVEKMVADELVIIERKGSSKGRATEYRLMPMSQLPKIVGEKQTSDSPTMADNSPTMTEPLPNSVQYQPSYTTTIEQPTASAAQEAADRWWREQTPRPLGKRAWHILLQVCKAAEERGYDEMQIYSALKQIGSVPSMQQMDRQLRNIRPQQLSARQQRLARGFKAVELLSESSPLEIEV